MSKRILSINIDAKEIFIADMDYTSTNPTVHKCFSVPLLKGMVDDGTILDVPRVAKLIREVCAKQGVHTKSAIFTLSSSKIATREVRIPYVSKQKIQAVIDAKASEYFPININDYTFAYSTRPDQTKSKQKKEWELLVFAAPNSLVQSYYVLARMLNVEVKAIDYDGNSIFQLMKLQKSSGNCMAIQVNNYNTVINVISNQQLLLQRVISYGISTILDAIVEDAQFKVENYDKAMTILTKKRMILEHLNENAEPNNPVYLKRQEITENFSYLINNFLRVMDYFGTKFKGQKIDEVMLTGVGSKIAGFQNLLQNELGVPVIMQNVLHGVKLQKKLKSDDVSLFEYMVCFGAAFRPVKFVTKEAIAKEKTKSSAFSLAVIITASVILCLVMIAISTLTLWSSQNTKKDWESKVASLQSVEQRYAELNEINNDTVIMQTIKSMTEPYNNRVYQMIIDMNKILPKSSKVVSMTTTDAGMVLNIKVDESLKNIAAFEMKLEEVKGINNVSVGTVTTAIDKSTKKTTYAFSVTCSFEQFVSEEEGEQ